MSEKDKTDSKVTEYKKLGPAMGLFSQEEIHSIVKEFIRAYIGGQIKLNLATPDEKIITVPQAVKFRTDFAELVSICAGIKDATSEQLKESIGKLFQLIAILQTTDGIIGTFLGYDISTRLAILEHNMSEVRNKQEENESLVKRILDYVERIDSYRGME